MNVLMWFKRDLRITDHPALTLAAGMGRVLPVYIIEPELWAQPEASARQWAFTAETLAGLQADLARIGAPLVLRSGDAPEVLARLVRTHRIDAMVSHEETTGAWSFARDKRVAAWARAQGIAWHQLPQSGVQRRHAGRDGWQARRDAFMAHAPLPPPALTPVAGAEGGVMPPAKALKLANDPCPHRQAGGRAQAMALVQSFLDQRGTEYRRGMSSPISAERACSRLSPHLVLGAVSAREVLGLPFSIPKTAHAAFAARLAWRDHFMQKLEDAPDMETTSLHPAHRGQTGSVLHLAAWAAGETGLPYVDACWRYLRATGWLNFRARAMLVSIGVHHLGLDWRAAGQTLARVFTDYEAGIHWPQMQMQAGVTGINAPRLYNPVKQGYDHDPTGAFIRRWVPELAAVPDLWLHEPWKWTGAGAILGKRYPEPLADPVTAARTAREKIGKMRAMPGFRANSNQVADQHGSRRKPGRFSVIEPPRSVAQLSLDL